MTGIFFGVVSSVASAVGALLPVHQSPIFCRGGSEGLSELRPWLFEFADLPEHDNLGAVGFRNIENKLELLISGTVRNVGPALARDVRLDIYHFQRSKAQPTHEISGIHVADALSPGEALTWSKSICLADLTVDGSDYQSGSTGIFRDDMNSRSSPPRRFLVQECTGKKCASSIYCTEKTIENNVFKGNKMVFVRQVGTYRPKTQFPIEWRREIETRERSLKRLMAV